MLISRRTLKFAALGVHSECGGDAHRCKYSLRALMRATASLIAFLVCVLNTSVISGNGDLHFKVFPRSPWVPMAHRKPQEEAISGCSVLHIS